MLHLRLSSMASMSGALRRAASASASAASEEVRCRVLVVGGGSGGCAMAAKASRALPPGQVAIIEPSDFHYYQPMFTLVGGGLKPLTASRRPMASVLPRRARWIKDSAAVFRPEDNLVETVGGSKVRYDFLVVAVGLELRYQDIKGLSEALEMPGSGVCSNYSPLHVEKTWAALQTLKDGRALFTFPNSAVKCPGAPQKIVYLADDYLRRAGKRGAVDVCYHTSLGVLFGVRHYADALWPLVKDRNINVTLRSELIEVRPEKHEAVFRDLDDPTKTTTLEYSMLHATPPQRPPPVLRDCTALTDATGYLSVDKGTLRHTRFPNVFGIGDCTNVPTSKTAAAVAAESGILRHSLNAALKGQPVPASSVAYDGYTSCPLVTGRGRCVLAEFDYAGQPLETFPVNQAKERMSMYYMKATFMPLLYWNLMLRGLWEGPEIMRKILHLGFCR